MPGFPLGPVARAPRSSTCPGLHATASSSSPLPSCPQACWAYLVLEGHPSPVFRVSPPWHPSPSRMICHRRTVLKRNTFSHGTRAGCGWPTRRDPGSEMREQEGRAGERRAGGNTTCRQAPRAPPLPGLPSLPSAEKQGKQGSRPWGALCGGDGTAGQTIQSAQELLAALHSRSTVAAPNGDTAWPATRAPETAHRYSLSTRIDAGQSS